MSLTNRMFPTKAIGAWRMSSMDGRADLIASCLRAGRLSVTDRIAEKGPGDPFYAVVGQPETNQ